ncbi:MAG: hypothetical protein A2854_03190 [Parcubacteria group bacterium RIFCSPHIGHO2_01_FULL_56_18]|nr:MAG: hypothetical protein A2854_03190 [Parcubacteria group bacterium RIFCSPHIGHO2_01_FULL_56_18]
MVLHEGGDYREMLGIEQPESQEAAAVPAPLEKAPGGKGWVHQHTYLAATIAICGMVVLGTALVIQRTDVNAANSSGAWGGAGGLFFGSIRNAAPGGPTAEDVVRLQSPQDSYAAIPIYTSNNQEDSEKPSGIDDITSLLAQLVQHTPVSTSSSAFSDPDTFSFIPQGLVSTEPVNKKQRTPEQEKLFSYGNAVGSLIKGFEDNHFGSAQILKDHVEDRTNPDKIRGLKILGADMQQLGVDLGDLASIPESVANAHRIYGNAYYAAGGNLVLIADTTTDEEFVNAITKYNAIVEKLSSQFQLLVAIFGMNEVTFSSSDPGNIFMFNPNLSLTQ